MSEQKYDVFQVVNMIGTKRFQGVFTKSELAEIMDGALYRKPFLGETGIQPEWINPLIELVPVDEVEDD